MSGYLAHLVRSIRGDMPRDTVKRAIRAGKVKPLGAIADLTEADVEQLLAAPNVQTPLGLRDRTMFEVLYATGLVGECVAFGVDHDSLGQAIQVIATAPAGAEHLDLAALQAECRKRMPAYMVPAGIEQFARGEFLFKEGEQGNFLYVFLSGEVAIQQTTPQGKAVTIATLGRGDVIGEMALFTGEPRKASALALSDVTGLRVDKDSIAELLESREELINAFVASMSHRLQMAHAAQEEHRAALSSVEPELKVDETALKQRIRRFFGL